MKRVKGIDKLHFYEKHSEDTVLCAEHAEEKGAFAFLLRGAVLKFMFFARKRARMMGTRIVFQRPCQ